MAKKPGQRRKPSQIGSGLIGRLVAFLAGLAWVVLLVVFGFFLVCLLSYSPTDPSLTYHSGQRVEVQNLGGDIGAWGADLLLTLFGRTSYLFLILLSIVVWRRLRYRKEVFSWNFFSMISVLGFLAAMIGAFGLERTYFPVSDNMMSYTAGGFFGEWSTSALMLNFSVINATLIFLGLLIIGITVVAKVRWISLMDRVGYAVFQLVDQSRKSLEKLSDKKEGTKVRRKREAEVKEFRTALSEKKPPKIEPKVTKQEVSKRQQEESQVSLFVDEQSDELPTLSLLDTPDSHSDGYSKEALESMSQLLMKKLKDFNVEVTVEAVQPGPVITRFEIEPAPGIKASQITGLARDLARSLSVISVRVVENIPGRAVVGIELPNQHREIVRLVEGLSSSEYEKSKSPLSIVLGKDIAGKAVVTDLMKMPHVLIAGTTGSGKSVCINALILSLLYKAGPDQVKMIMVDPKFLELSVYDGIPHLLAPVVTDMNKAANALRWCIFEMDRRFRLMSEMAVRNIAGFNKKVQAADKDGQPLRDPTQEVAEDELADVLETLPYIVVVVDELADLMMVVGKKIEEIIIRIAQRARAAGIHLVLATQRPSVDVVTGLIKANVPTRIAFQVSSRADSRTVLDQMGAEQLLGQGDMLFLPPGSGFTQRVHGSFVSDEEVSKVVKSLRQKAKPVYLDEITSGEVTGGSEGGTYSEGDGEADPLYDEAVSFVTQSGKASISALQRALRVGYNRAARMIESMEQNGVISTTQNGKREVLAPSPPED